MENSPSNKGCRFKLILLSLSPVFGSYILPATQHTMTQPADESASCLLLIHLKNLMHCLSCFCLFRFAVHLQGCSESTLTSAPPFHTLSDKISVKCVVIDAYSLLNGGLGTAHPTVSFSHMRTEGHGGVFSHNRDKPSGINYCILN